MQYSALYPDYWQWPAHFRGIRLSHDTKMPATPVYYGGPERLAPTIVDEINPKVFANMVTAVAQIKWIV